MASAPTSTIKNMKCGLNRYRAKVLFQLLILFIITLFFLDPLTSFWSEKESPSVEIVGKPTSNVENDFFRSVNMMNYKDFMDWSLVSDEKSAGGVFPGSLAENSSYRELESTKFSTKKIPKIFYTFWAQGVDKIPYLVKRSIISWKVHNPEYAIILVTLSNVKELIQSINLDLPVNFYKISHQFQSDWVRLALLSKRGGVWVDASIFMTDSIDPVIEIQMTENTDGFMFYLDMWTRLKEYKYFENWFIASTPGNPTINAWFREFDSCFQKFSMKDAYLDDLKNKYGLEAYHNLVQGNTMPYYLKAHMGLQKVMQIDGVAPFSGLDAADIKLGPLVLSNLVDFNEEKLVKMLLIDPWPSEIYKRRYQEKVNGEISEVPIPKYIKLRNFDRKWIHVYLTSQTMFPFTTVSMIRSAFFNGGDYGWFLNNIFRILYYGIVGKPGKIHPKSVYCKSINANANECRDKVYE